MKASHALSREKRGLVSSKRVLAAGIGSIGVTALTLALLGARAGLRLGDSAVEAAGKGVAGGQKGKAVADLTMTGVRATEEPLGTLRVEVDLTNQSKSGNNPIAAEASMNVWVSRCPTSVTMVTPSLGPDNCETVAMPGTSGNLEADDTRTLSIDAQVGPGFYLVLVDAWARVKGDTSRTKRGVATAVVEGGN